jgi:gas vesicle structural protein
MSYRDDVDFLLPDTDDEQTLVHLLDRLLDKGVVVSGDLTISVAGVDLLFVGLKVLLASVDTAERFRMTARRQALPEAA